MSQDAFAEALDVSRRAVSKWENNETKPDTAKLILMSELFHVSIDYLLKDETTSKEQSVIPDIFNHGFFKNGTMLFVKKAIESDMQFPFTDYTIYCLDFLHSSCSII